MAKIENKKVAALALLLIVAFALTLSHLYFAPADNIGVIDVYTPILFVEDRDYLLEMIDYALKNETIKAVVLRIDTPGGYASFIEDVYMSLLRLKAEKPIVASISFGPSGGYYIAIAADCIFVAPQSITGNIGVIGFLPSKLSPQEDIVESGPYKITGFPVKDYPSKIQMALETFLDAVEEQRSDKLKLNRTELSKALLYFGEDAVRYGLADELGSSIDAAKMAAKLAGIEEYNLVEISKLVKYPLKPHNVSMASLRSLHSPPALYYIYSPLLYPYPYSYPSRGQSLAYDLSSSEFVLIDYSHENAFQLDELNVLISEIVFKGYSVRYLYDSNELESHLKNSTAFIIISPTEKFTSEEINSIKTFVEKGNKLLLIADPSRASTSEMNTIANEFGVVFASGYLYNLEENYGNYKNIIVSKFETHSITEGLNRVVFFTATHIYTSDNELCFTTNNTFSSESEISKEYSPIVLAEDVLAIGDQTFLSEPYCYIEDNYKLIMQISSFLTK